MVVWLSVVVVEKRKIGRFDALLSVQYDSAEWELAFLRQAREFLFFSMMSEEASK